MLKYVIGAVGVALCSVVATYFVWINFFVPDFSHLPRNIPFDVSKKGQAVEFSFPIKMADHYKVGLEISYSNGGELQRGRLRKLLDETVPEPGVRLMVRAEFARKANGKVPPKVIVQNLSRPELRSWAPGIFDVYFEPTFFPVGDYDARLIVVTPEPRLRSVQVTANVTWIYQGAKVTPQKR